MLLWETAAVPWRHEASSERVSVAPDQGHVRDFVEELGLTQARPADTVIVLSQTSKRAL